MLALVAALLAQSDPRIESVERLAGNVNRPYLWAPLAVTIASTAGFEGDVVAQSSLGVRVVRRVRLAPGGKERLLLPAVDPQKVLAGSAVFPLAGGLRSPDHLVLVDARLPYAGELVSDDQILYVTIQPDDLEKLLALGVLDACDLLLLKDGGGLSLGGLGAWALAPLRADAAKSVAGLGKAAEAVKLVDPDLWALAPEGGWVPAKRDRTILFAVLYAFASFGALAVAGRRHAKWAGVAVAAVAGLGVAAFVGFFPRAHLWISESSCEIVPAEGDAALQRLWFTGAAADLSPVIEFPRVVKPVFAKLADAEEPLTIRILERGSVAEGFALAAGRRACFAAVEGRPPTLRPGRQNRPLYRVTLRRGGVANYMGDLEAGAEILRQPLGGTSPSGVEEAPWLRFLEGDGVWGWLEREGGVARDVGSPDLADGRRRPGFFLQRMK